MDNKFTYIKERILYIAEIKGISKGYFCEKIGMTYANFKGEAKKTPINSDAIVNTLSVCPDVDPEWLLTGQGSMFRNNAPIMQQKPTIVYEDNPDKEEILSLQRDKIKYLDKENNDLKQENESLKNALTALSKSGASYTGSQEIQTPINPPK